MTFRCSLVTSNSSVRVLSRNGITNKMDKCDSYLIMPVHSPSYASSPNPINLSREHRTPGTGRAAGLKCISHRLLFPSDGTFRRAADAQVREVPSGIRLAAHRAHCRGDALLCS